MIRLASDSKHRKMFWMLLSGAGLLAGCVAPSGYKPVLPESCTWLKFPYSWICIDPKEGTVVPEKVTFGWEKFPIEGSGQEDLCAAFPPIQWEELVDLYKGGKLGSVYRLACLLE